MREFFKNYANYEWVAAKKGRLPLSLAWQFVSSAVFTAAACATAVVVGKFLLLIID